MNSTRRSSPNSAHFGSSPYVGKGTKSFHTTQAGTTTTLIDKANDIGAEIFGELWNEKVAPFALCGVIFLLLGRRRRQCCLERSGTYRYYVNSFEKKCYCSLFENEAFWKIGNSNKTQFPSDQVGRTNSISRINKIRKPGQLPIRLRSKLVLHSPVPSHVHGTKAIHQ